MAQYTPDPPKTNLFLLARPVYNDVSWLWGLGGDRQSGFESLRLDGWNFKDFGLCVAGFRVRG